MDILKLDDNWSIAIGEDGKPAHSIFGGQAYKFNRLTGWRGLPEALCLALIKECQLAALSAPHPAAVMATYEAAPLPDGEYTRDNGDVITVVDNKVIQVRNVQVRLSTLLSDDDLLQTSVAAALEAGYALGMDAGAWDAMSKADGDYETPMPDNLKMDALITPDQRTALQAAIDAAKAEALAEDARARGYSSAADVSDIVEAFRIAGPIALADFKSHPFILTDKEEAAVALITAALAQIGAARPAPQPAAEPWPKEETSPGVFVDVDPETLARSLMDMDQCMGEAMDMVNGPDDPRMLPWDKQPQEVKDRWIAKVLKQFGPQPAADTRVVVKPFAALSVRLRDACNRRNWEDACDAVDAMDRAIIDNATPAPSDKIAEAAPTPAFMATYEAAPLPDGEYTRDNGDIITVADNKVIQVRRVQVRWTSPLTEALDDIKTHRASWKRGINTAYELAGEEEDRLYWVHEMKVLDRVADAIIAHHT